MHSKFITLFFPILVMLDFNIEKSKPWIKIFKSPFTDKWYQRADKCYQSIAMEVYFEIAYLHLYIELQTKRGKVKGIEK